MCSRNKHTKANPLVGCEFQKGYYSMNTDLVLMFGALILLAISALLVFCFTEAKGKNTPHARREKAHKMTSQQAVSNNKQSEPITH
jgi:hypothetical protein